MALLSEYTSGSANGSGYNITVVFDGADWTEELQAAFIAASDYLSTVILGDVQNITADFGDWQGVRTIDDLEITATLNAIDGVGGILGQAGPQYYRTADFTPITGVMQFDTADAQNLYDQEQAVGTGDWTSVVLHEMLHTMGFGSMWQAMGLVTNYGTAQDPDWRFAGANAQYEYQALYWNDYWLDPGSDLGVAVESSTGSPGTDGSHWDEAIFGDELMTGFLDPNATLSNLTLAALQDMGYQTTYSASAPACFTPGTLIATPRGPVPVEDLRRGDLVWTADHGFLPVNRVAVRVLEAADLARDDRLWPMCIAAGALGAGMPERDLRLSPQHRVLVRGRIVERLSGASECLVPVKDLAGLPGIGRERPAGPICYLHLKFTRHEVVVAEGAEVESFMGARDPARPILEGRAARDLARRHLRHARPLLQPPTEPEPHRRADGLAS